MYNVLPKCLDYNSSSLALTEKILIKYLDWLLLLRKISPSKPYGLLLYMKYTIHITLHFTIFIILRLQRITWQPLPILFFETLTIIFPFQCWTTVHRVTSHWEKCSVMSSKWVVRTMRPARLGRSSQGATRSLTAVASYSPGPELPCVTGMRSTLPPTGDASLLAGGPEVWLWGMGGLESILSRNEEYLMGNEIDKKYNTFWALIQCLLTRGMTLNKLKTILAGNKEIKIIVVGSFDVLKYLIMKWWAWVWISCWLERNTRTKNCRIFKPLIERIA